MHCVFIFVGLATLGSAVPIQTAKDGSYGGYSPYKSYTPYNKYGEAAEAEAKKVQRDIAAVKRAETKANGEYGSYTPYVNYDPYPEQVEVEAAKQGREKRHMMLPDSKPGDNVKREVERLDASEMAGTPGSHADAVLPNNWYGKYDPYSDYGKYGKYYGYPEAVEAEAEARI